MSVQNKTEPRIIPIQKKSVALPKEHVFLKKKKKNPSNDGGIRISLPWKLCSSAAICNEKT